MNHSSPTNHNAASSLPAGKITRKQLAAHCGLCVSRIDQLTRAGVLGHYRIGKSVRYDLAEVEATLRQLFHVGPAAPAHGNSGASFSEGHVETLDGGLRTSRPTSRNACARPARGRAGCPQTASRVSGVPRNTTKSQQIADAAIKSPAFPQPQPHS